MLGAVDWGEAELGLTGVHALVPVPVRVRAPLALVQPRDVHAIAPEMLEVEEGPRVARVEHSLVE